MRILYIDCGMGAAGDMLSAALLELVSDKEAFVAKLNEAGVPKVKYICEESVKCGITGSHMTVLVNGEEEGEHEHHHDHHHEHHEHHEHAHSHTNMHSIEHIVKDHLKVSDKVKEDILSVYSLIAQAESKVHGKPVDEIHFHEVGNLDAVADITAVAMLLEYLEIDRVIASPVHVGSGQVKCAHGILPVPAPATAEILRGCPIYGGKISGELCTPTGAALVKHFVTDFGDMPVMSVEKVGYGMGKKDFEVANCVRVMLGETNHREDKKIILEANVDDMTAEEIGYAFDCLYDEGAREVFMTSVLMKKNRPGTLISVICDEDSKTDMIKTLFKHTSTIGIRESKVDRYVLDRYVENVETEYGVVRKKVAKGYGVTKEKYEYDDLCIIASEHDISIEELKKKIKN